MSLTTEQRVEIGKKVRFFFSLIEEELNDKFIHGEFADEFWIRFAEEMKRRDVLQAADSSNNREFTDAEGHRFGQKECPFNQYKGVKYHAVPYDYLAFIVDSNKLLERYLRWRYSTRGEQK